MGSKNIRLLAASSVIFWASGGMAATEAQTGKIARLLTDTVLFGQCMVWMPDAQPTINCPARWVSLDCKGDFNSKETSRRLWDAAQLGFATESSILVVINDEKKHNGYCVADRLDVVK